MKNVLVLVLAAFSLIGLTACDDGGSSNRNDYCYNSGYQGFNNNGYQQIDPRTGLPYNNSYQQIDPYTGLPYNNSYQQIDPYTGLPYNNSYQQIDPRTGLPYNNSYQQIDPRTGRPYSNVNSANCGVYSNGINANVATYDCNSVWNGRPIQSVNGRCDINGRQLF